VTGQRETASWDADDAKITAERRIFEGLTKTDQGKAWDPVAPGRTRDNPEEISPKTRFSFHFSRKQRKRQHWPEKCLNFSRGATERGGLKEVMPKMHWCMVLELGARTLHRGRQGLRVQT
jgi:hypothetical protein